MLIEYLADRKDLLPELAQLHFDEWGRFNPSQTVDDRIASLEQCCKKSAIPSVVVATNGNELLGSAMLVPYDMSTLKDLSPWLAGVYVKSDFRKAGVATALVKRVEQEAAALDVPTLYLYTDKEARFYEKRDWKVWEACEYKGLQVTIMIKEIEDTNK